MVGFIGVVVILAILLYKGHKSNPTTILVKWQRRYAVAQYNAVVAEALHAQANERSWQDLCLELASKGHNSALKFLKRSVAWNKGEVYAEEKAEEMFLLAARKLQQIRNVTAQKVKLAQYLVEQPRDKSHRRAIHAFIRENNL